MAGFVFDLKHAIYAAAGAVVGAIIGYLFGIVLYIVVIASSALASNSSIISSIVGNASFFPVMFTMLIGALGFFGGYYVSHRNDSEPPKTA